MRRRFENDLVIKHHGIPGMRWGVRNGPPYPLDPETDYSAEEKSEGKRTGILGAYDTAKKIKNDIKEANRQKKIKNRTIDPKDLTDEELNDLVKRLKLEEQFLELAGRDTPKQIHQADLNKGKSLTEEIMGDIIKKDVIPSITGLVSWNSYKNMYKKNKVARRFGDEPSKPKEPSYKDMSDSEKASAKSAYESAYKEWESNHKQWENAKADWTEQNELFEKMMGMIFRRVNVGKDKM